jgi:hypothetical protein
MHTTVRLEDTRDFQIARLTRICNEMAPGKRVDFYERTSWIRFKIRDDFFNISLTDSSGEWVPSVLAGKSDDELRAFIKQLSNGKIR